MSVPYISQSATLGRTITKLREEYLGVLDNISVKAASGEISPAVLTSAIEIAFHEYIPRIRAACSALILKEMSTD